MDWCNSSQKSSKCLKKQKNCAHISAYNCYWSFNWMNHSLTPEFSTLNLFSINAGVSNLWHICKTWHAAVFSVASRLNFSLFFFSFFLTSYLRFSVILIDSKIIILLLLFTIFLLFKLLSIKNNYYYFVLFGSASVIKLIKLVGKYT